MQEQPRNFLAVLLPRRRAGYLGLLVLLLLSLIAAVFITMRDATPAAQLSAGQSGGQSQNPLDVIASQVRNGLLTEQLIASQKEALARDYTQVTPGTAGETVYRQQCSAFMLLLGEDPNKCQPQIPSLASQLPPPVPSPVPTILATIVPSVSIAEAWGSDLKIDTIPLTYGPDYNLMCAAITGDGKSAVCAAWSMDWEEHGGSRPGKIVLVDLGDHQVSEIRTLPRNDTQAFDISADDQWVVWEEATDVMGDSDGVIYAYNLTTHLLKQVTHATLSAPRGTVRGPGSPYVGHGMVLWVESLPLSGGDYKNVVRKLDLSTWQIVTLAENAFGPRISWPYISWLQVRESTPQLTTHYIKVLDLQSGVTKTLRDPYTPNFAIRGKDVVWSTRNGEVVLTDVDEAYRYVLARGSYAETLENLTINDRLVSWNGLTAQVWDREQKRLVTLTGQNAGDQFLSGKYFVWTGLAGGANSKTNSPRILKVLDTSTLRK